MQCVTTAFCVRVWAHGYRNQHAINAITCKAISIYMHEFFLKTRYQKCFIKNDLNLLL